MKVLALSTGILSLTMFIVMVVGMFVTNMPIPKVLEIQGYGSMMMLSLVIGLGLILGAYEEKWK